MGVLAIMNSDIYTFVIIPLLIFLARIVDVSIGTIRVIFIAKGFRFWAPLLGFFEVLIWLAAINQIMNNLNNIYCYIAYAAGFATGTYVGIVLEDRLSVGKVMLRLVTRKNASAVFKCLKKSKYATTCVGADGPDGKVKSVSSVIDRQDVPYVLNVIKNVDPNAFYSIEDVRFTFENNKEKGKKNLKRVFNHYKKAK